MGLFSKEINVLDYSPRIEGGSNGTHSFKRGQDTAVFEVKRDKNLKNFEVIIWQRKRHAFIFMAYDFKPQKFVCYGDDGDFDTGTKGIKINYTDDKFQFIWEIPNTFALENFNVLMRVIVKDHTINYEDEITILNNNGIRDEEERKRKIEELLKYDISAKKVNI